jgi:hypothetical protein
MDTQSTVRLQSLRKPRASRATDALRGEEDLQILGKVGALLIGIGVGIGVLIAPSSGEETRADISSRHHRQGFRLRRQNPSAHWEKTKRRKADVNPFSALH